LRAVRFAARFGFRIDLSTRDAIHRHAKALAGVSRERIGHEMRMMLTGPRVAEAIGDIQGLELDAPVLNELHSACELKAIEALPDPSGFALRLAAWAVDRNHSATGESGLTRRCDGGNEPGAISPANWTNHHDLVRRWRAALVLTNRECEELRDTLQDERQIRLHWRDVSVPAQKRLASRSTFAGALAIVSARAPVEEEAIRKAVEELGSQFGGLAPEPFLDGGDIAEIGLIPGPAFKRVLDAVYDAQLDGRVRSAVEARAFVKSIIDTR
jgi:poly(A) polymerase